MTVKLRPRNPVEILQTQEPPRVRHLIRSQNSKTADSEKRSLGYETMTTVSDLDSEVSCNSFSVFATLALRLMSAVGVVVQK